MELKSDFNFRKQVANYLGWIFTTGTSRWDGHEEVCLYLIENWSVYRDVKGKSTAVINLAMSDLHYHMAEEITDDVFTSLSWPTDADGNAIRNPSRQKKQLIDKFCDRLEEMRPMLESRIPSVVSVGKRDEERAKRRDWEELK